MTKTQFILTIITNEKGKSKTYSKYKIKTMILSKWYKNNTGNNMLQSYIYKDNDHITWCHLSKCFCKRSVLNLIILCFYILLKTVELKMLNINWIWNLINIIILQEMHLCAICGCISIYHSRLNSLLYW